MAPNDRTIPEAPRPNEGVLGLCQGFILLWQCTCESYARCVPRDHGKPVVGRSRSRRLGTSRLSNSMRNLSGAESVRADAEGEYLFSVCNRLIRKLGCIRICGHSVLRYRRLHTVQMEYGGECHISGRPYTVFRWRPGNDARYVYKVGREIPSADSVDHRMPRFSPLMLQVQENDHMSRGGESQKRLPGNLTASHWACHSSCCSTYR